ncbi:MAG: ABC transporter substrate-binding protein [Marmoricola sp.]
MTKYRKTLAVVAAAAMGVTGLAACGGGGGGSADGAKTLHYLTFRPTEHWDPQRMYIGRDLADSSRLFYRSLVSFPVSEDPTTSVTPVPDLATDTGKASNKGKTWKFTLKDGVKWEDGKPVTCEDVKYGISRTFDLQTGGSGALTGGPNYILGYIDAPDFKGPYKADAKGQAQFDKAVVCDGATITFNFKKGWNDLPLAIASLRSFDPYRKDKDQGDKSNYQIFSNGPYKLDGAWVKEKGGTFVKNTEWDASTDTVRKQLVDKIVFTEGITNELVAQRLIASNGDDAYAVTDRSIPPSIYAQVTGDAAKRATLVDSPFTGYLLPNFKRMTNPQVRKALMLSTDRDGWAAALGGEKSAKPSSSIVNPAVAGYAPNPAFADMGNYDMAKKTLKAAGKMGYPIIFTFSGGSPTSQKAAAALKQGWEKGGFKVSLNELTDTYYTEVQKPNLKTDVVWGGWGADWPSISTVIPPLFDSRLNISKTSNGQDYGNFVDPKANKMFDAANAAPLEEQPAMWAAVDKYLGEQTAYIPLDVTQFYMMHGSKVTNYMQTAASNMYPDLGAIGVE